VTGSADIVIPTFNNGDELRACLDALEAQDEDGFRVIVCVDGSTDGTTEELRAMTRPYPVIVLEHDDRKNHGRARSRNLALPYIAAEHVLLLDSDMRLAPDGLRSHLDLLRIRDCVSVGDVRYDEVASGVWGRYQATRGKNKATPGAAIRPLDFNTQNAALRAEHLRAVGGFDETLTGYGGEDTELGLRLAAERDVPFVFNAAAVADTVERKTIEEGLSQLDRFARTNLQTIRRRHPGGPAPFWIDRMASPRLVDRLLRLTLNPITERVVRLLLPRAPFAVQRRLLDYLVIRTVFRGFAEGSP
jgi:glycosyltransferase involved in cell wall biosynthesis